MKELKKYLLANSIFSAVSGFVLLSYSKSLNSLFNLYSEYALPIIGLNLLAFATFVYMTATRFMIYRKLVFVISFLDFSWVLGSFAIILFRLFGLSNTAYTFIGIVAFIVGFLGIKQYKHNKDVRL